MDRDFALHDRVVEYRNSDEAAAFIAALSRVLSSPIGVGHLDTSIPVEVLAHVAADSVTVYSSESAADAANRAFSPVPFVATIAREALPLTTIAVVTGPDVTPLAAEAAQRMLERR